MADKSKSGKLGILHNAKRGVLIEGDGITPLADNSWFIVVAAAAVSTLPVPTGYMFKSPDNANAITPAVGDDLFPLTLTKICKVDASVATEKGAIDVTDDCSNGYNSNIPDGFVSISGSAGGFLKFSEIDGSLNQTQKEYLGKFFDIITDDGEGTYSITPKDDEDIILAILKNSDQAVKVGNTQVWQLIPVILTSETLDNPLKGAQPFDFNWTKGQGAASIYERVTNGTEVVL